MFTKTYYCNCDVVKMNVYGISDVPVIDQHLVINICRAQAFLFTWILQLYVLPKMDFQHPESPPV